MSIFDSLQRNARPMQASVGNPMQALQQIKSNPVAVLRQRGLNVPDGMNNPQQIVQHLLNSGQITNNKLQMAMQMMRR